MDRLPNPKVKTPVVTTEKVSIKESLSIVADFFSKNPFMKVILPIVIVISFVSVVFIIKESMSLDAVPASSIAEAPVYVLPMKERVVDGVQDTQNDPFSSNIVGSFAITGIISNPSGASLAIISSELSSYIVGAGDEIGTTGWIVVEMTENTATLEKDGKSVFLKLAESELENSNNLLNFD